MQIEVQTMSQILWTMQNLSFDETLCRKFIEEVKIQELDSLLLKAHFLENMVFEQGKITHYSQEKHLPAMKQKLLEELLWHIGNFACSDPTAYMEYEIDKQIHLLCLTYKKSLSPVVWAKVTWIMKSLSRFAQNLREESTHDNTLMKEEHDYSTTDIFSNFCAQFSEIILEAIGKLPVIAADFVELLDNTYFCASDEI